MRASRASAPVTRLTHTRAGAQLLAFIAIVEAQRLAHVVALLGAFLGIPLIFIYPAAIHMQLMPDSRWRIVDKVVVTCGILTSIYCTAITIKTWRASSS